MASIVLTLAGSAVGNALLPGIGGAILGGIGGAVGGMIDTALFGGSAHTTVKGPRLDQLKIQDSSYGNGIPIIYGRNRLAGNVIWASDLIETITTEEVSSGGGKGGGRGGSSSVERATYAVDCAIAIGQGLNGMTPLGGIATIWADGKLVYSNRRWKTGALLDAEFYLGSATQNPSPLMESALGSGLVPAYRGVAYVVLHHLQLADYGNRLPNFTFEVIPTPTLAPQWLGDSTPNLTGRPSSFANASALPPLALEKRGSRIVKLLAGAIEQSGTQYRFVAIDYDTSGDAPVEITRTASGWVTQAGDLYDFSWGLSPDGRHVAFYMLHFDVTRPITVALYDSATHQFGAMLADNFGASFSQVETRWLDAQHFVLPDIQGTTRGVRLYTASGLTPVLLGFYDVAGAGSSTSRALLPFAQFAPLAGGAFHLMANSATAPTALYLRTLRWNGNTLEVGSENVVSSGISSFSTARDRLLALGGNEFALARYTTSEIRLFSFLADYGSVSTTRNWASISLSPSGEISPNYANGVIGFLHQQAGYTTYRYGEIYLTDTGFTLGQASVTIGGSYDGTPDYFSFFPLDSMRHVMLAGNSADGFARTAIFMRNQNAASLATIVGDLLDRAGYAPADYDVGALANVSVSGYVVPDPAAARAALEPLAAYYPFDLVENDGVLLARPYSAVADAVIDAGETRATFDATQIPPQVSVVRAQELDLPREVTVDYIDPALDYQKGSQRARRVTSLAHATEKLSLPVVCAAAVAKQIAEKRLYRMWMEREQIEAPLSRSYLGLSPGDVVTLDARNLRIIEAEQAGGVIRIKGVPVSAYMDDSGNAADSAQGGTSATPEMVDSVIYLMDLPLLRVADDMPGFYVAACGSSGWRGAGLYRSADGVNFTQNTRFTLPATAGVATNVLADAPPAYMDRVHTVTVALLQGSLSSCSDTDLLNGGNAALLGNEIIQFGTATLNADGSYTLSNLLRGRRGTESATGNHAASERFVLLQQSVVTFLALAMGDRGRSYHYRGVSLNQDVSEVANTDFTHQLQTIAPFAPAHVTGTRNSSSDLIITWKRRARLNAEWQDYIEVPLDEDSESYDLEIMNGASVARSFSALSAATATYSATDQTTDFGAPQASVTVRVYQVSSRYGRGAVKTAIL